MTPTRGMMMARKREEDDDDDDEEEMEYLAPGYLQEDSGDDTDAYAPRYP